MSEDINNKAVGLDRSLPAPAGQNTMTYMRADRYGDQFVQPIGIGARAALSLEGTYFIAHNATNDAATTLAGHAAPVLADADATMTKPFIHAMMSASAEKYAVLDFIEIEVITAGANGTADSWAAQLDTGATRVSSGGTALTSLNANMRSTTTPGLTVLGGAVVTGAESSQVRNLGFGQFRPSIQIAGDKYLFLFGRDVRPQDSIATIAHHVVDLGPVVLGASDQLLLALYSPSQSAAGVYKVRMGWSER